MAYTFSSQGRPNYVFAENVMPYEGYVDLPPFTPTRDEIAIADSVLATRQDRRRALFAQYGGVIGPGGERIVAANYVYREPRERREARCGWFFGLGPYFEAHTRHDLVDVRRRSPFVIEGPR